VLCCGVQNLGGRDFDGRLVDHFAEDFTQSLRKKGDKSNIYDKPRSVCLCVTSPLRCASLTLALVGWWVGVL
jgi:hypothetical protein